MSALEKRSACIRLRVILAPTTSWWWKVTTPSRLEAPGARLADVVHQRGEAGHEVGPAAEPVLEVDRLLEHGQGVLVDVLVPVVLVALERQGGQLGQHVRGEAGLHEQGQAEAGVRRADQLDQLVAHPLGGDDLDPAGHRGHRRDHLGGHGEAELGGEPGRAHHPQRVVGEGVLGGAGGPQHPLGEVDDAAVEVLELAARHAHGHRVEDPHGGVVDLAQRVLRTPGTPEDSFSDDPLRMMRAARFAAQLGFTVAPEVVAAMTAMAERIEIISAERVRDELVKLVCAP